MRCSAYSYHCYTDPLSDPYILERRFELIGFGAVLDPYRFELIRAWPVLSMPVS
jgi:hypothetical protein